MRTYDEDMNPVESPDLEAGWLAARERIVVHRWVVDVEEQGHDEVIAEYPETGGKDVAWVVDVEEKGHWETRTVSGEAVEFDGEVPDGLPHDSEIADVEQYAVYTPYTPDELAEIAREMEEAERAKADAEAREAYLAGAPARTEALEGGQEEQMDALAELGALAAGSAVTLEDVLNAVAELGAMVAGEGV